MAGEPRELEVSISPVAPAANAVALFAAPFARHTDGAETARTASKPAKTWLASEPAKIGICWSGVLGRVKSRAMVLASHVIFTAYGFWLPNDPRGSWSDFVGAWELLKFGRATKTESRRSVAAVDHDRSKRQAAKLALKRRPVRFTGRQALAIAHGFSIACGDAGYRLRALAIMPDHVHGVVGRHERSGPQIVGHLKSASTRQLRVEGLHPFDDGSENLPTVWVARCWTVFLNSGDEIQRAVEYVNQNPVKAGLPPQSWSFVRP
jgi:REP element-mobilizing transposase RayT